MFKKLWNSDIAVLFRRLFLIYILLFLCRIIFYIYNLESIGRIEWGELPHLFQGSLMFDTVSIIYAYGLFIIMSLIPFRVREKRWYDKTLFWCFIVTTAAVVALNFADTVYFHYTGIRLTGSDVMFADNDNTALLIGKFLLENWFLFLIWGVFVWAAALTWRYTGKPSTPISNNYIYLSVNLVILIVVALFSVAMARGGGLSREIRPITLTNAMAYSPDPAKANMILSNPFCIIRTWGDSGYVRTKYFVTQELDTLFSPYHFPQEYSNTILEDSPNLRLTATGARRNIIVFILESFSAENSALLYPELYPDSEGFTPFLDSLMNEGYYFTEAYANGYKSINAMPAVLGSLPSLIKPIMVMPQGLGESKALPKILSEQGYDTYFFCGSRKGSMGFDAYVRSAGVEYIYSKEDYDDRYPGNKDHDGYWGVWDEYYLKFMGEVLSEKKQPFMSTVFTLTSHHPFVVPEEYNNLLPDGYVKSQKPISYTDLSIKKFFEKNSHQQWFKNSLFIFVADHVSSEKYSDHTQNFPGNAHIITFFYTPDGSLTGKNENVFQQTDIMPTILGLFDYREPYFGFGRDIFREKERIPVAISYRNSFNIVSDSVFLSFDGTNVLNAYKSSDIIQENDISNSSDPEVESLEKTLKAFIQQYYRHIEAKNYIVPDSISTRDLPVRTIDHSYND